MTLRELLEDHGVSPEELLNQQIGGVPTIGAAWMEAKIEAEGTEITIHTPPVPYNAGGD